MAGDKGKKGKKRMNIKKDAVKYVKKVSEIDVVTDELTGFSKKKKKTHNPRLWGLNFHPIQGRGFYYFDGFINLFGALPRGSPST